MTTAYRPKARSAAAADHDSSSVGQLMSRISEDLSHLFRQEVNLAKAEIQVEATKAGKAAGAMSAAGLAAYSAALLLSLAAIFALGNVMDLGLAALLIAAIWALAAAALFVWGRDKLRKVSFVPQQTVETIKEDAQWLRHPTRYERTSS